MDGKGQQSQLPPSGQPIGQPVMQSVTPPTGGGQPIVQPVMQPVTSPTGGAIGNDAGALEESQGEGGETSSQIPPSGQPIDQPIGKPVMQPFGSNEPPVQSSAPTRNPTIPPTADPTNSRRYFECVLFIFYMYFVMLFIFNSLYSRFFILLPFL